MGNWITKKIQDIGTVVGGATPSTKDPENYEGGNIPWITPKDLAGYTKRYISKGERNITDRGLKSCSTQMLPPHTVLFSSRAPIGYIAIAQNEMCTNQGFKSVIPNDSVDYLFLYYLLLYNRQAIESLGSGTTFKEVSGTTMRNVLVTFPESIDEQKKIARILSTIDDAIENNDAISELMEKQANALFRSWFVDYEPYDGILPSEWKMSTLGDVSVMSAGGDKPKKVSEKKTKECPYAIYSNGITDEGLYGYTDEYKISKESVTVSARGTIGFVCLRHEPYTPIVRLVSLVPYTSMVSGKYLYLWLKNTQISGTGTTQLQLTVPDFRKTEILVPSKEIMDTFTERVTPLFQTIWDNQETNKTLRDLRDTLLPKLMKNELDISQMSI